MTKNKKEIKTRTRSTTQHIRKHLKKGRESQLPVGHVCIRGNPFGVMSHPVALSVMCNDTFCTITIVVVQNVPVAHAHNILPWLPVLDRAASGYFWWHHFRLEMCTRSLPVAPPPRSTLSNTTLSVPIYYLKGIGFVKRLYESGVIGLIGINLFIFIQKMTQTSSFVCLLVQTRLIVHYALALNVCTGFINLHKKQRPNIQPNCILWRI
jgi:heme/copper-type cytochrome/quinol oxidase subunit 1